MSHHEIFVSSFSEARHKPDPEDSNLCGMKEEYNVLRMQRLLSK